MPNNNDRPDIQSIHLAELRWLLESPVMISPDAHPALLSYPLLSELQNSLKQRLEQEPQALYRQFQENLAARRSTRLGIRYESLWQSLYQTIPEITVLACNLQVQDQQRHCTLGEYDLLYRMGSSFYHLELAIKFYLGRPGSKGHWFDWLGLDQRDQLGRKMKLLLERQIRLTTTKEGQSALAELAPMADEWQPQILLQGYLFYPWQKPCEPPHHANPHHLRSDWLPLAQLEEYLSHHGEQLHYTIPQRQQWLMLDQPMENNLTGAALYKHLRSVHLRELPRPVLVVPKPVVPTHEISEQRGKPFFVTPDNWLGGLTSHAYKDFHDT